MRQAVSVLVVGCFLVGGFVGTKVGQARWSHRYYRKSKQSMPGLRKAAWAEIRYAATATLLVALLVVAFVWGINAGN
jgi:ABC-type Fe3+ transport system permease subunit